MREGEIVGQPPLDYDIVKGKLILNKEEAKIVRYIFDRYLHGAGSDTIALELECVHINLDKSREIQYN